MLDVKIHMQALYKILLHALCKEFSILFLMLKKWNYLYVFNISWKIKLLSCLENFLFHIYLIKKTRKFQTIQYFEKKTTLIA